MRLMKLTSAWGSKNTMFVNPLQLLAAREETTGAPSSNPRVKYWVDLPGGNAEEPGLVYEVLESPEKVAEEWLAAMQENM